jgi:hypothetical protein
MPDPILIGKAFAASATAAFVIALLVGRDSRVSVAGAGRALAVVIAMYAGLSILGLLPHFPPREALDRLLLIVLPAALVAEAIASIAKRFGWIARATVAVLAAPVLLWDSLYITGQGGSRPPAWSPGQMWLIFAALGVLLMAYWTILCRLAPRAGERLALGCVSGAVLGTGVVIMLSGYATGGQVGMPLAAGLGGVALGSLLAKGNSSTKGALGIGIVGLFGLLLIGRFFAGLTSLNAALLFAAPLVGFLPELLPARLRVHSAWRLGLAAIPVVLALVIAQHKFAAESASPGSGTEGSVEDYTNFSK